VEDSWATFGADLHLELAGTKVRAAVERALREAVRTGRLAPGTRLPSSRSLARDLGVARNTVADAYGLLVAEGWLTARQGSGTRVAHRPARGRSASRPPTVGPNVPYDLQPGTPDVATFPRSGWLAAAKRAIATAPNNAFGYADPHGRSELRSALAEYLARARGVRADPERIVICAGYVHALALLSTVLRPKTLAVEALSLDLHRDLITANGVRAVPIDVDGYGARTDLLGGTGARAVLLTPAHQFPTGVPLHPDRRAAVVGWARRTGGLIIEDDYDGEFRYDRQQVGALQDLDPDHVVYAGTASKSLAPGLRLAWLVVPPSLLDRLLDVKASTGAHHGVIDQLTLAEFLRSGAYDRHVRSARSRYRRRRDRLVATLSERVPDARVTGIAAGLHVLVELPPRAGSEEDVISRARERGLALAGLGRYRFAGSAPPSLVVGYGTPADHAFAGALDRLCDAISPRVIR
jgi:GntR family transcriptional regulator / MocR family aminotransferase